MNFLVGVLLIGTLAIPVICDALSMVCSLGSRRRMNAVSVAGKSLASITAFYVSLQSTDVVLALLAAVFLFTGAAVLSVMFTERLMVVSDDKERGRRSAPRIKRSVFGIVVSGMTWTGYVLVCAAALVMIGAGREEVFWIDAMLQGAVVSLVISTVLALGLGIRFVSQRDQEYLTVRFKYAAVALSSMGFVLIWLAGVLAPLVLIGVVLYAVSATMFHLIDHGGDTSNRSHRILAAHGWLAVAGGIAIWVALAVTVFPAAIEVQASY